MKKFFIAAAFLSAAASPGFAATTHHMRHVNHHQPLATDSYAMAPETNTVVEDGQVLGADPDPFIREQLLREGNPGDYEGH